MNEMDGKEVTKNFSADKSELGFEYQFYFFLWKLLEMKTGETVSWEVKDDVSLDLPDGTSYLFQVKHTIQKKSDGMMANLTDLDSDLWKTLSNWSQIINSKGDMPKQKAFLKKTFFVLASNKSEKTESITRMIENYVNGEVNFLELKKKIIEFQTKSENEMLKKYIGSLLKLDDEVLILFIKHIQFQLEENDLIKKCKNSILEKMIPLDKVDLVYDSLYSNIRNDNYITIKNGEIVSISFENFQKKYRRCFEKYRSGELVIKRFIPEMPDKIEEQTFIKQLVEIGDIENDDLTTQMEYTKFKLLLERNLEEWCQSGEITGLERDDYFTDGINQWENEFHSKYRGLVDSSLYNEKGLQIIDELRKKNLCIKNQQLPTAMSNGTFYHLADVPEIGFRKDWEDKYAK